MPNTGHYHQSQQVEIAHNLWEATCFFCEQTIYKRMDDAHLFDPWYARSLIIVEWP